jgi:O-antigen ligase
MIFHYVTGKNFAFRILIELAVILWLGLIILRKEYRPKNSILLSLILIFTFIVGLANLLGVNPYNSFWSNYERMEGYITILHLLMYFIIIRSIFRTKKDWMIFFNMFLLSSVCVSLYALYFKYIQGFEYRAYSTIGNAPFLASYLLLSVFFGIILIFNTQKKIVKYTYSLFIILNFSIIYFTGTRGVILALLSGVIIFSIFYIFGQSKTWKQKQKKKLALLSTLGAVVILITLAIIIKKADFVPQNGPSPVHQYTGIPSPITRFSILTEDPSVLTRLEGWKIAVAGIGERPLLGWGQENFISVYTVKPPPYGQIVSRDRPHNIILEWLVNAGILGCVSYLAIFGFAIYVIRKAFKNNLIKKYESVILITFIIIYLIQNLVIFDTINTYIIAFVLLGYIDNVGKYEGVSSPIKNNNSKKVKKKSIFVVLFVILIFCLFSYFINIKPIKEAQLIKKIFLSIKENRSFKDLNDDFDRALSLKTFGDSDVRLMMMLVAKEILRLEEFTNEGALQLIRKSAEEMEKLVETNYLNLRYWSLLIDLYNIIGVYEPSFVGKAEEAIKKCLRISPGYQWVYLAMADNFVIRGDYKSAYLSVKKAVDMDPKNDMVQLKLAIAGIFLSKDTVVQNALEEIKKIRMARDVNITSEEKHFLSIEDLLILVYSSTEVGDYERALQFYKEIIDISPNEAQYYYNIAEIYYKLGDIDSALREAKKAEKYDPVNYGEKTRKFIDLLK